MARAPRATNTSVGVVKGCLLSSKSASHLVSLLIILLRVALLRRLIRVVVVAADSGVVVVVVVEVFSKLENFLFSSAIAEFSRAPTAQLTKVGQG